MPSVKPVSFLTKKAPLNEVVNLGSSEDVAQNAIAMELPYQNYEIYAPIIGENIVELGAADRKKYLPLLTEILQDILTGNFVENRAKIQGILESSHAVRKTLIYQLYFNLSKRHTDWDKVKASILEQHKEIFQQLESYGAQWHHIRQQNKAAFLDLGRTVFNTRPAGLTAAIGDITLANCEHGYENFIEALHDCLPLGGNINAAMTLNPKFGSFLHYYLAFEFPYATKLIQSIDAQRSTKENTLFDYEARDGYGNTPLLIAVFTRQESAVLALLGLMKKGRKVGIDMPDADGRTPLLIAAALGMKKVVAELLNQGANPLAQDKLGRGLSDYSRFSIDNLSALLRPFVHPERSANINHSYLYANDIWKTPLCYFANDEQGLTGDAQIPFLVVLSPLSPHKEKLNAVVACLQKEARKGDEKSARLLAYVQNQIEKIVGTKTVKQLCMEGQTAVQDYLMSTRATTAIRLAKESRLRRACALGDINLVRTLLDEGINPNTKDHLERTALHYAVMRAELIQKELLEEANERGESPSAEQVKKSQAMHPQIIECLINHSKIPLDWDATNKAKNSARNLLVRDAESQNQDDAETAKECLKRFPAEVFVETKSAEASSEIVFTG
ncbi:ankyrin repeat protein [Legionella massiliensis]|uniref:Ankyrin repeat protein n=1 Tax=Legionella massiliensis TaxID=1034943 RepID=A0A078KU25_9GAMM|nr:ankyrin repeat domain-containing protein [Legionella massiliensis]CDZ76467.1 ankyrin repeat protein [Legionella massiliensis]CEE12205.1 Ankyrin repeat protein [Legionella massiliensis]